MSDKPICAVEGCGVAGVKHNGALFYLCPHHFCTDEQRRDAELSRVNELKDHELFMLKDFYQLWIAMHAIKTDELHMRKKQQAAQELWDQAQKLKNFYLPTIASQLQ